MRNLKRALSLTLASVMLLGMMVVGAGAASYPDVDDADNIEAIEVLQAVKVMQGDEKGNFRPDDSVSRAEMAVVMANLLNLDYQYYEASCPFTDVPNWARPYVGACYANKIVSGYNATTYGANDTVTAVQAASMMMRALGYFQYDSDYADGFETSTVRQGTRIGIFNGVGSSATAAMSRNQVAQMALNALEATMVDARKTTADITVGSGDTAVSISGSVEYIVRTGAPEDKMTTAIKTSIVTGQGTDGTSGQTIELGEQLYNGDLVRKDDAVTGFYAPATRWSYKNTEIGTYADDENYMLEGTVKSSAMYSTVGKTAAEDYEWKVYVDGESKNWDSNAVKDNNSDDLDDTGRGTRTYVYLDNTAHGSYAGTATVCILNTYAAEVTKVADGKITLDDMHGKSLEVEAAGYAEDDVVLYTKYKDGSSWVVAQVLGEAELVEGEAKTVRDGKYVVIGDTTYNYSAKFDDKAIEVSSAGAKVAIYLDGQGNIIYLGEVTESQDYALVLSVGYASNKYDASASEFGAKLMLSDGTTLNVDLDKDYTDDLIKGKTIEDDLKKVQNILVGRTVSYSKEKDGTYTLDNTDGSNGSKYVSVIFTVAEKDVIKNGRSSIVLGKAYADRDGNLNDQEYLYANSNTVYVLNDTTDGTTTYSVYTGYENVPNVDAVKDTELTAYVDRKGIVKAVFITDADVKGTDNVIFVVSDTDAKETKTDGFDSIFTYKAIVNGEATTIDVKSSSDAFKVVNALKTDEIAVFNRMTTNGDGYVTKLIYDETKYTETKYSGTEKLTGSVLGFGYNKTDKVCSVHIAPTSKTVIGYLDGDELEVRSDLESDVNDPVITVLKDGELLGVFVTKLDDDKEDTIDNTGAVYLADNLVKANVGTIKDSKVEVDKWGEVTATFTLTKPEWAAAMEFSGAKTSDPETAKATAVISYNVLRDGEAFVRGTSDSDKITASLTSRYGYLTANADGTEFTGSYRITKERDLDGVGDNNAYCVPEMADHTWSIEITSIDWHYAKVEYKSTGSKTLNVSGQTWMRTDWADNTPGFSFSVANYGSTAGTAKITGVKNEEDYTAVEVAGTTGAMTAAALQAKGGEPVVVTISEPADYVEKYSIVLGTGASGTAVSTYKDEKGNALTNGVLKAETATLVITPTKAKFDKDEDMTIAVQLTGLADVEYGPNGGTKTHKKEPVDTGVAGYKVSILGEEITLTDDAAKTITFSSENKDITINKDDIKITPIKRAYVTAASWNGNVLTLTYSETIRREGTGGNAASDKVVTTLSADGKTLTVTIVEKKGGEGADKDEPKSWATSGTYDGLHANYETTFTDSNGTHVAIQTIWIENEGECLISQQYDASKPSSDG